MKQVFETIFYAIASLAGIVVIFKYIRQTFIRRMFSGMSDDTNIDNGPEEIRRIKVISDGSITYLAKQVEDFINDHDCYCDVEFLEYNRGVYTAIITYTEFKLK